MSHLGARLGALVDGELGHRARERALAHVAGCDACRAEVEAHRAVKDRVAGAPVPQAPADTISALLALAAPGGPLPPRSRAMPLGPVVPDLPAPGRRAYARPAPRRSRLVAAGAFTLVGVVLATAFVVGGAGGQKRGPVVPPVAELSVEHSRTSTGVTVGDPAAGLTPGAGTQPSPRAPAAPGR